MMLRKFALCALLLTCCLAFSVSGLNIKTGDRILILQDEVINDNLFVLGKSVTVAGRVNGDIIALGQKLFISGTIEGNAMLLGGEVLITGLANNIFLFGAQLSNNGVAKKDLIAGGLEFFLGKDARVGKDVFLACLTAYISGDIYRHLRFAGRDFVITPTAMIKGKVDHSSRNFSISNKAKVLGEVTFHPRPEFISKTAKFLVGYVIVQKIISLLAIFIIGILAIVLIPQQVETVTNKMTSAFGKSLWWGIFAVIFIPLLIILLCLTVIGIPLALLALGAYILGIYISGIYSSLVIGKKVFRRLGLVKVSLIWSLFFGLIIFQLIGLIPLLGWFIRLIFFFWAFGALISTRYGFHKKDKIEEQIKRIFKEE